MVLVMFRPFAGLLAALSCHVLATTAQAEGSLGLSWANVTLGVDSDEAAFARLEGDWRISEAHGLQFGLGYGDRTGGAYLSVDAGLYLMPAEGRKYGFYAQVDDIDNRSLTLVEGGVQGMLALSDRTVIQGRAGAGTSNVDLDWLTVSAGISHDLSSRLRLQGSVMLAEFDEAAFRAVAHEVRAGVRYRLGGSTSVTLMAVNDGLHGRNAAPSDTRIELGVTWTFGGSSSGNRVADRAFDTPRPADILVRRGLF